MESNPPSSESFKSVSLLSDVSTLDARHRSGHSIGDSLGRAVEQVHREWHGDVPAGPKFPVKSSGAPAELERPSLATALPVSPTEHLRTIELTVERAPLLQQFFDENPEYFLATSGEPAGPYEALEEIAGELPAGMPFTKKWVVGYVCTDGSLVAMANVITDLLAVSIHHIGTFILATRLHGSGQAQLLYQGLERWASSEGAAWLRLGVVQGNARAERFWAAQDYLPVRERPGIEMGKRVVTVRNMVKPLAGGSLEAYFALAPRDRPEPSGVL